MSESGVVKIETKTIIHLSNDDVRQALVKHCRDKGWIGIEVPPAGIYLCFYTEEMTGASTVEEVTVSFTAISTESS